MLYDESEAIEQAKTLAARYGKWFGVVDYENRWFVVDEYSHKKHFDGVPIIHKFDPPMPKPEDIC